MISMHDQSNLSPTQKTHIPQPCSERWSCQARGGRVDQYEEAVDCMRKRYDRLRLLHQAHVRVIIDEPLLKDGSGKELHRLHDTVNQHHCTLKAMDYEASGPSVTSLLEFKLD